MAGSPRRWEGRLVVALAVLAGLRVLFFSLAFPFFSNVDEYRHLDVVLKYARGYRPVPGPDRYEAETIRLVGELGSPEYQRERGAARPLPPPPWRQDDRERARRVASMRAYLGPRHSLEADQPPVYYAVAGAWLALGRALGLPDRALLHWVRGLGAGALVALVLASGRELRELYPERPLPRLGVPLLLAFVPQDALYYVTGDALAPLLGGLAFLLALRLVRRPELRPGAHALAGLMLAAAFLTKYPAVALAPAAALLCGAALSAPAGARGRAGRWTLYWAAFLLPALWWLGRNAWLGGDPTGTAFKVEKLGWGRREIGALLDHPLFTPAGAWTFLRDLVPRFWRGELVWYREEIAWPPADALYLATTLVFVPLAALGAARSCARRARAAEAAALAAVLAAVAVLAGLSLLFVFGEATSPSAAYPYFVQGRLVSAVLLPFALAYVRGIELACEALPGRWRGRAGFAVLAVVVAVATVSEALLHGPVYLSAYNALPVS